MTTQPTQQTDLSVALHTTDQTSQRDTPELTRRPQREIKRINYRGHWIEVHHYRDYDGTWLLDCAIDGEFSPIEGIAARGNLSIEQAKQIIDDTIFD